MHSIRTTTINLFALVQRLMLATIRSPTRFTKRAATATTLLLLAASSSGITRVSAAQQRFTHHKSAAAAAAQAAVNNGNTTRNASYASDRRGSGAGWDSSVDNPFKMDRPVNVFGRPLTQCGTNPMTGFYRDGVRSPIPLPFATDFMLTDFARYLTIMSLPVLQHRTSR